MLKKKLQAQKDMGLGRNTAPTAAEEGDSGSRPRLRQTQSSTTIRRVGFPGSAAVSTVTRAEGGEQSNRDPVEERDVQQIGDVKEIGTPDAPIWNHLCQLYVERSPPPRRSLNPELTFPSMPVSSPVATLFSLVARY